MAMFVLPHSTYKQTVISSVSCVKNNTQYSIQWLGDPERYLTNLQIRKDGYANLNKNYNFDDDIIVEC